MQGIFDFFASITEFFGAFADWFSAGVATVTTLVAFVPLPLRVCVMTLIGIYAVYALVGRGGSK